MTKGASCYYVEDREKTVYKVLTTCGNVYVVYNIYINEKHNTRRIVLLRVVKSGVQGSELAGHILWWKLSANQVLRIL